MNIGKYVQMYSEDLKLKNYAKSSIDLVLFFCASCCKKLFMNYKQNLPKFSLVSEPTNFESATVSSSSECYNSLFKLFDNLDIFESFYVLFLNRANITTGYALISQGGICSTIVDVRIVAKYAVESLCTSVILAHNHPSGNLTPSDDDKKVTKKIKEALHLFDISVLDHIILTPNNKYFSFNDNDMM